MGRRLLIGALVLMWCAAPACARIHLTPIGRFASPVYVTAPPGDARRLFVVEKAGRIMEVRNGIALRTPFLDITHDVRSLAEQGLLSMAFAPDYATSRRLYIDYTAPRPRDPLGSVITVQELRTASGNPDAIDPASRRTILTIDHPRYPHHHGGLLLFGPDGALYVGTGDAGNGHDYDPPDNAQRPDSLLGKLLRVDPATGAASVFASGLRNPWRFSFDAPSGELVIGDVGQNAYEEVDVAPAGRAGLNFGWRCFEGFQRTPARCGSTRRMIPPVLVRDHNRDGYCAIVGGYVVHDPQLRALDGRYLYGDHCQTRLRSAALVAPPARVRDDVPAHLRVAGLNSFGEDSCGHVFTASATGIVGRIDGDRDVPCPGGGTSLRVAARAGESRVRVAIACGRPCAARISDSAQIATTPPARHARVSLALPRRRGAKVLISVSATDAAGNRTLGSASVRVRQHVRHG